MRVSAMYNVLYPHDTTLNSTRWLHFGCCVWGKKNVKFMKYAQTILPLALLNLLGWKMNYGVLSTASSWDVYQDYT